MILIPILTVLWYLLAAGASVRAYTRGVTSR